MTYNDLLELKHIAVEVMQNALEFADFEQFAHGLKLWQDITKQIKERN